MRLGIHAFVFVGEWNTESGNYAIDAAAKSGFEFVEIPLLKPREFDAASHRAALKAAGIGATCSLVLPKGAHMPQYPDVARAFLFEALEKVEAVGSQYLGGCIAYDLGYLTGKPPTAQERETVVQVLRDVADEAEKRGITLALEACNRYETYLYNTLEETRETILAVSAHNLKLHADTYHMNIEEDGFYAPFEATADVLDYIHMSESHRGMLGTGTVNWDEVWRALHDINFKGKLVMESFAAINPDLQAATCMWRPPKQSPMTLATEGYTFLSEGGKKAGIL